MADRYSASAGTQRQRHLKVGQSMRGRTFVHVNINQEVVMRRSLSVIGVLSGLVVAMAGGLGTHAAAADMLRIGVTQIATHAALDADEKGFEAGLASAGFKEGVNVVYDRQNAQGDMPKAQAIAKQFVDQKVALIHAIATPTAHPGSTANQPEPPQSSMKSRNLPPEI